MIKKLFCIILVLFHFSHVFAAVYYATPSGAGDNSGDSWPNAMAESDLETSLEGSAAAGDIYFVAGGTYTLDSAYDVAADGTQQDAIKIIGVASGTTNEPPTFADWATGTGRPLFAATSYSIQFDNYTHVYNIRVTSTASPALKVDEQGLIYNCKVEKTGSGWSIRTDGNKTIIMYTEATNATGDAAIGLYTGSALTVYGCYVHDSAEGLNLGRVDCKVINTIIDTCTTGIDVASYNPVLIGNTLYGANTGTGVSGTTAAIFAVNNIFQDWTTGVTVTTAQGSSFLDYNNYYSNTTDVSNVTKGPNAQSSDAGFTNASSGNFTIGENLKADGFPGAFPGGLTTGYMDIGAAQREEPAASGGGGGATGYFSMD